MGWWIESEVLIGFPVQMEVEELVILRRRRLACRKVECQALLALADRSGPLQAPMALLVQKECQELRSLPAPIDLWLFFHQRFASVLQGLGRSSAKWP